MAETDEVQTNDSVGLSEIIKEQSNTIKTMVDQIKGDEAVSPTQPIYWTSPFVQQENGKPNYVLFIIIGLGIWFLTRSF